MNKPIINFILFQIGWFACVLGAANQMAIAGVLMALVIIIINITYSDIKTRQFALITTVAILGYGWDSVLVWQQIIIYTNNSFTHTAPIWIAAMWAMFATTLNSSLSWMQSRYVLAAVLGALFGPLAYYSGAALGALDLQYELTALVAQSVAWSLLMPIMLLYARFINHEHIEPVTKLGNES